MNEPDQDVDSLSHVDPDLDPAAGISKWLFRGKVGSPDSGTGRGCSSGQPSGCSITWSQGVALLRKASRTVMCLRGQCFYLLSCDQRRTRAAAGSMLGGHGLFCVGAAQPQQRHCCNPRGYTKLLSATEPLPALACCISLAQLLPALPADLTSCTVLPGGGL